MEGFEVNFNHICCLKEIPNGFYQKSWKLHLQWAPKKFFSVPEEPTIPVFMPENTEMLKNPPYKRFTPCKSFFGNFHSGEIKYRFHQCRCRIKHCLLRNSFPTYHPDTGLITSVVNQKCIKSQCDNVRREKCGILYPMHQRNFRQIVLWDKIHLDFLM